MALPASKETPSVEIRRGKGMFNDPEVGTAAHDNIVNWLANPTNMTMLHHTVQGSGYKANDPQPQVEPVIASGNFIIGFADLIDRANNTLIEVKTGEIRTGEVLRQINAYRQILRTPFGFTYMVTPQELDADVITMLYSQGVAYVHYQDGQLTATHAEHENTQRYRFEAVRDTIEEAAGWEWARHLTSKHVHIASRHHIEFHLGDLPRVYEAFLDQQARICEALERLSPDMAVVFKGPGGPPAEQTPDDARADFWNSVPQ